MPLKSPELMFLRGLSVYQLHARPKFVDQAKLSLLDLLQKKKMEYHLVESQLTVSEWKESAGLSDAFKAKIDWDWVVGN